MRQHPDTHSPQRTRESRTVPVRKLSIRFEDVGVAVAGRVLAMVFFFYYGGGGAQGALVSVAVSAGLMLLQRGAPEHLVPLLTCGLVMAAVAGPMLVQSLLAAAPGPPRPPRRDDRAFAAAVERVRKMRTELYNEPGRLSVAELRRRLGSKARGCLERNELERAFRDHMDCCAICSENWAAEDVYRVLPKCGHCFHVECIDRWALLSAGKGKGPKCPLCNTVL